MEEKKEENKKSDEREELFEERLVMPERVKVREDDFRNLYIEIDGREFRDLKARRVFPLSGQADYISFINKDGRETVMLAHPHKLDRKSRETLENALRRMYYVARITRVDAISEKMGITTWEVDTDRGYARFEIVDRENIRRLPGSRVVLSDADGNRFEIPDMTALDLRSRNIVFSEV